MTNIRYVWPQEVTLVRWTQPSGPLCLWQCFPFALWLCTSQSTFRQKTFVLPWNYSETHVVSNLSISLALLGIIAPWKESKVVPLLHVCVPVVTQTNFKKFLYKLNQNHQLGRPLFEMCWFSMGIAQIALDPEAPSVKRGNVEKLQISGLVFRRIHYFWIGRRSLREGVKKPMYFLRLSPKSVTHYDENRHSGDYVDS